MQQRVLIRPVAGEQSVWMCVKEPREFGRFSAFGCFEQLAVNGAFVDMTLERPPAWKAILAGKLALRVGKRGAGISGAQFGETALGFLA